MAQLQISFDQVSSTPLGGGQVVNSSDEDVKVAHRTNSITANISSEVLKFMVSQGLFLDDTEFDWEEAAAEWVRQHGDEVEDYYSESPYWYEVSCAYELLQEAMEQADQDAPRVQTAEMYVENVYYYYGINSVCKKQTPLPYSEFMRACDGFATRYHRAI